jgi:hypothetical protein
LELKVALFDSLSVLKAKYVQNMRKQLSSLRGQFQSILNDYRQFGKYMTQESENTSTMAGRGDNILVGKLSELTDVMSVHLATTETQVDIREEVTKMVSEQIREIVELDLAKSIQIVENGTDGQDG